ncbi:hypothetical protein ACPOL_4062 [Acidisarcina polymorpha]|uniref:Uncharacterized protein n=1 Tax=Acidisarcina polymorpha TaxID=2211140 RepID=A0A2Z5G2I6_9BACT|nr:hypothetical protein ACPOL_4062 [Acidisarcina polymorpha]
MTQFAILVSGASGQLCRRIIEILLEQRLVRSSPQCELRESNRTLLTGALILLFADFDDL